VETVRIVKLPICRWKCGLGIQEWALTPRGGYAFFRSAHALISLPHVCAHYLNRITTTTIETLRAREQEPSIEMAYDKALGHSACDSEPIHVPGSIQPYGLLCVIDRSTDLIMQAAGDATRIMGFRGSVLGHTAVELLGVSLDDLVRRADTAILSEPVFLANLAPFDDQREVAIAAHQVDGVTVVEALPSTPPSSSTRILAYIRSITHRIGGAANVTEASELAAIEAQRITGYERVLIYRFLSDGSGSVIAEANGSQLPRLLNHRFPGSDIPAQARELYLRNAIRTIPDVDYIPAPLMPAAFPLTRRPLDMSHCQLRSVSPIHIRYLKNMGVGASMSVSLLQGSELWGLIVGHNTTAKMMPYETQEVCRHVGQILSQRIRASDESQRYQLASELSAARDSAMRPLIAANPDEDLLPIMLLELQSVVPSSGAAVVCKGTTLTTGRAPARGELNDLAAWVQHRLADGQVLATDRLSAEFPPAKRFAADASGLLAMVLPGDDPGTVMWFRSEQIQEINWAGNPHEPPTPSTSLGVLNPRRSFATWQESVRENSKPWEAGEIESARAFIQRVTVVMQKKRLRQLNTLLSEANERLSELASQDGLTGLSNRRKFDERLLTECSRASRTNASLALLILDVDFFKQYNDNYGHAFGDACLKQVALVLQEARRATDLAARIGGEEFALILPDTDIGGAAVVAEGIRARIEGLHLPHAKSPLGIVTVSVGVAVANSDALTSARDLMLAADKALYKAKSGGRNASVAA
jgi:diguanylate cyclase (GGDEF)-like protein